MKLDKRELPLGLIKLLNDFTQSMSVHFSIEKEDDELLTILDKRSNGLFWFKINRFSGAKVDAIYRPYNSVNEEDGTSTIPSEGLVGRINFWTDLCNEYENVNPRLDPEESDTEQEIFQDLKILDDDAHTTKFTIKQQLLLETALDRIAANITTAEESIISTEDKKNLTGIINALKQDIAIQSKNGFMHKVAGMLAKARRSGVKAGNWIFKETIKELIKEGVKAGLHMNMHSVSLYLSSVGEQIIGAIK